MKRCSTCRHGIVDFNGDGVAVKVTCALIPPTPVVTVRDSKAVVDWVRPVMIPTGWCGQHRLSWLRLFGYGARA